MGDFTLDVGLANKLKNGFSRTGWSLQQMDQLGEGDNLAKVREMLFGEQVLSPVPKPMRQPLRQFEKEALRRKYEPGIQKKNKEDKSKGGLHRTLWDTVYIDEFGMCFVKVYYETNYGTNGTSWEQLGRE
jgi:hypothetical protein